MRLTVTKSALKWILLLSITTQVCYCDDWFHKELAKLEEGCMEMSYEALTPRYISIISIYKYSDNPEGFRYNKCYLRFQKLGNERMAKVEETRRQVEESWRKGNEARRQQEQENRNQQHKDTMKQIEQQRRAKEKSKNNTVVAVVLVMCGLVVVGICVCALHKRGDSGLTTVNAAGQPLVPTQPEVRVYPTTVGLSPNNLDIQTIIVPSRSPSPVPRRSGSPLLPTTQNSRNADERILVDEPPSYDEAVRATTPLPSAPPKGY